MAFRDRWLGAPEGAVSAVVLRALSYGSPALRIRAARTLAERGETAVLVKYLDDPIPGVRRAAIRGLGWATSETEALTAAQHTETTMTGQILLAAALWRSGCRENVLRTLTATSQRAVFTVFGERRPSAVCGHGLDEVMARLWLEVGGQPGHVLSRERALDVHSSADVPEERWPWLIQAAHHRPHLLQELRAFDDTAGRRGAHVIVDAIGTLGDPRAIPRLHVALAQMDTDPGHGFRQRKAAAFALGRIGDPGSYPELRQALDREALEFEGRPGAGLGVQFPVRNTLLWAIGESGADAGASLLAAYLGNTEGSATGGFYLPAMGALLALPPLAVARALRPWCDVAGTAGAHARGVLEAQTATLATDPGEDDPDAICGLAAFRALAFFEAHEHVETAWRKATGDRRIFLQALIQGAVALEHARRGNSAGGRGQLAKTLAKLDRLPPQFGGVDLAKWRAALVAWAERVHLADTLQLDDHWPVPPCGPVLSTWIASVGYRRS